MMLEADLEGLDSLESTTNQSALAHLVSLAAGRGGPRRNGMSSTETKRVSPVAAALLAFLRKKRKHPSLSPVNIPQRRLASGKSVMQKTQEVTDSQPGC